MTDHANPPTPAPRPVAPAAPPAGLGTGGAMGGAAAGLVCFTVLGSLGSLGPSAGLSLAMAAAVMLGLFLHCANARIRARYGGQGAMLALGRGMMAAIPLTILAGLAEAIGWHAATVFAPAALAAVAYTAGAEAIRLGGGRFINMAGPGLGALGLSTLWVLLTSLPGIHR